MFITGAIERGVDVKVIAEWQGHRDGGKLILATHSHVRPEHSNRMAALMTTEQPENVVPITAQARHVIRAKCAAYVAIIPPKTLPAITSLTK